MAPFQSKSAPEFSTPPPRDVVEIGLLLTAGRVNALIALSRKKRQSVGQILRDLIDRELQEEGADRPDRGAGRDLDASEALGLGTLV